MSAKIVPLIPKHTVYVEPFCGGASLFFAKPQPVISDNNHYREYLNDKDERLINFYRVLQTPEKREQLIERLQLTLFSESEHRKAKHLRRGNDVDLAWAYYVNVQQSFSNVVNSSWRRSVYGRNEQASWARKVDGLAQYLDRMAEVGITCQDALKVIQLYDSPQTFFYCDPPYPQTNCGNSRRGYAGYTLANFQELITTLNDCQGSFIVSNYDQPDVNIPADWERFEFNATCTASIEGKKQVDRSRRADKAQLGDRQRTEVIWRRFNRTAVRDEIQKLFLSGGFECFVSGYSEPPSSEARFQ